MMKKIEKIKELLKRLPHYPTEDTTFLKRIGFWLATGAIGSFGLAVIIVAIMIVFLSFGLPDVAKLDSLSAAESTEIFDREGELLYTIHGEENRAQIDYKDISKYVIDATVAIEDNAFWEHSGFDLGGLLRGALYEIFGVGTPRGGSTITQQYVKNTFLSPERSYIRKAKELVLSVRLERAYEKKDILELYLNRIPYGNNAYGVEKAAEVYFGKHASELDLAEAAVLASLPQAPSRYNPYGNNKFSHLFKDFTIDELHYRKIKNESDLEKDEYVRGLIGKRIALADGTNIYIQGRTDLVLKAMQDQGEITPEQRQEALNKLQILEFNTYRESIKAPHFVFYVKQILEDKYGKDVVERGGLKVYTTIDGELQEYAEKVTKERGEANEKAYGANNAAVLTVNSKTGEILAMVGSRDYFNEEIDGNVNVVTRPRQPGSSFKPIVYAQAFYNGVGPGTVVYDVPTKVGSDRPENYSGNFLGQITVREALGKSRNIPAVKAYFVAGQQDPIIDLATKMGITTLDKSHSYGYPLAIGAGEIPLFEMVNAYATFSNAGKRPILNGILKVENTNGDVLEEFKPEKAAEKFEEVLDPQIAYMISSILSDRAASVGTAIYVDGKINAAKTGTSTKENKKEAAGAVRPSDGWTLGYTPSITTGVWIGNTDGTGLGYNADGYNAAAPIFKAVMTKALEKLPNEDFVEPEGIKHVQISRASGKLPGPNTPADMVVNEIFSSFSVPTEVENIFFTVKIDKVSGLLATEFTPQDAIEEVTYQKYEDIADMFNWNAEIEEYYKKKQAEEGGENAVVAGNIRFGVPPTEYDNVHTAESAKNIPSVNIVKPGGGSILPVGNFEVNLEVEAKNGVERVEFYVNDKKEYFTSTAPYTGHLSISKFMKKGDTQLIVAKVIDKLGYSSQAAVEIKVGDGESE